MRIAIARYKKPPAVIDMGIHLAIKSGLSGLIEVKVLAFCASYGWTNKGGCCGHQGQAGAVLVPRDHDIYLSTMIGLVSKIGERW